MLGLRVPVSLQVHFCQSGFAWRVPAALNEEAREYEKAADVGNNLSHTLVHNGVQILAAAFCLHARVGEGLRVSRACTKNSMLWFSSSGLIEYIQKFDSSLVPCG